MAAPLADPDGDAIEQVLWVDPCDLTGNPMVRDELAASLGDVLPLLGCEPEEIAAAKAAVLPKARRVLVTGRAGS